MTVPSLWLQHRRLARTIARDWWIPGYEPQDVEQEALIALWEAARCWKPDGGASFKAFARQVIGRRLRDALRNATRLQHAPLNGAAEISERLPHLHQVVDTAEDRESLARVIVAIGLLTDEERTAVVGIATGSTYAELAHIGGPKRVDNVLYRARRKLKAAA